MFRQIHILTLFFLLCCAPSVYGQADNGLLSVSDLCAEESAGRVTVSFTAVVNPHAVGSRETVVFVPVLTDGVWSVSLPAVAARGKGVRRSFSAKSGGEPAVWAVPGEPVHYSAAVEAQSWMHGGQFRIESAAVDCAMEYRLPDRVLSEHLHLYDAPQATEIVTEVRRFVPRTVADSLSMIFPFVVPEAMFDPDDPFRIYDEEREGALVVYYHQGQHAIDPAYRDNGQTLLNLTAASEIILGDPRSRVERVVVAGFASPEGRFELNDALAFHRAVAVKHHLLQATGLCDEQVWIYNGSVDWRGLRLLIERSDMPQKSRLLAIFDRTPPGNTRLEELQRLDDGAAYAHMLETMFPLLRNGAFIKVYYSNEPNETKR